MIVANINIPKVSSVVVKAHEEPAIVLGSLWMVLLLEGGSPVAAFVSPSTFPLGLTPRVPQLYNSISVNGVDPDQGVGVRALEPIRVGGGCRNHDVLLLVKIRELIPEFIRGRNDVNRLTRSPSKILESSVRYAALPDIQVPVKELSVGLLEEHRPDLSVVVVSENQSLPALRWEVGVQVDLLPDTTVVESNGEDTLIVLALSKEDSLDPVGVLSDG